MAMTLGRWPLNERMFVGVCLYIATIACVYACTTPSILTPPADKSAPCGNAAHACGGGWCCPKEWVCGGGPFNGCPDGFCCDAMGEPMGLARDAGGDR